MKRTRSIKLVLLGTLSVGALNGCGPQGAAPVVFTNQNVFTNNTYVPNVGYYHAPFRAWHSWPYNYFDPATKRFFYGGQWAERPHQSIINISQPTPEELTRAAAATQPVRRHGFGSTGHRHSIAS